MKTNWTVIGWVLAAICASYGAGVVVGVIFAAPKLIKAHCFVVEPTGIARAVHEVGICEGMVDASRAVHVPDRQRNGSR